MPLLTQINFETNSIKELAYGIEWLIIDKFITDVEKRNYLFKKLSDKMSGIYEFGELKREEGWKDGKIEGEKEGMKKGMEKGLEKGLENGLEILVLHKKGVGTS